MRGAIDSDHTTATSDALEETYQYMDEARVRAEQAQGTRARKFANGVGQYGQSTDYLTVQCY